MSEQTIAADTDNEEEIPFDEFVIHDYSDETVDASATVESDVLHSTPTLTDDDRETRETLQPVTARRPDPSQDLDAFLEGADIDELESLARDLARIPLPPSSEVDLSIDPMGDLPEPVTEVAATGPVKFAPVEMPTGIALEEEKAPPARAKVKLTNDDDRDVVFTAKEQGITLLAAAQIVLAKKSATAAAALDDLVEIDEPIPAANKPAAPSPAGSPATVAEAEARLYEMDAAADSAQFREYDDEKAFTLREEMRNLRRSIPAIAAAEKQSRDSEFASAQASYETVYDANEAKAREVFPELANAADPIHAEMVRLDLEAQTNDVALYGSPTKFFDLAVEARRSLARRGVTSTSSSMSAPAGAAAPVSVSSPRNPVARGVSASPSARATTAPPATPRLEQRIEEATTSDDLAEIYALMRH